MSITKFKEIGVEVSLLHVADECMRNGWSAKTALAKLTADFDDDIDGNVIDLLALKEFCSCAEIQGGYEHQRKMIFEYLFDGNMQKAKRFFEKSVTTARL